MSAADIAALDASASAPPVSGAARQERVRAHAWYALAVLALASIFNFADRQIASILAQSIKGDLGLTDAQLGFLLGTAFAVFYAVVGIVIVVVLLLTARRLRHETQSGRRARAEAYGEPKH